MLGAVGSLVPGFSRIHVLGAVGFLLPGIWTIYKYFPGTVVLYASRNLMAKEEFEKLGFTSEEEYQRIRSQAPVKEGKKEGMRLLLPLSYV